MRGSNFSYLVKQGLSSVWHNRLMSFASFCIMVVSLLLISLSALLAMDIGSVMGNIESKNEILVFIGGDLPGSEVNHIGDIIKSNVYTATVQFRSREEALEIYAEQLGEDFVALFDALGENPMPYTFTVSLNDVSMVEEAARDFRDIRGVEKVEAPYEFARFLTGMRTTLAVIGTAMIVALIAVSLVIVYNTARASVFARRMEISIMKVVGATNAFIRFPFFIEGMSVGIIAGVAAWFLAKLVYESVVRLFAGDATIWQVLGLSGIVAFETVSLPVLLGCCAAGAILGALGTVLSMGKHLRV